MAKEGQFSPMYEGVQYAGPPLDERGFIRKQQLRVGAAKSLSEMSAEYVFFTPAPLYLFGAFTDAPLIDFMHAVGQDVPIYFKSFRSPVFRGLDNPATGDPGWNYGLWAVHREHWQALSDFLVSITLTYSEEGAVAGIGEHTLVIADPLAVDLNVVYTNRLPVLTVFAFGLNGSKFRAAIVPGTNHAIDPPRLRVYGAAAEMQIFAKALYGGKNPINAVAYDRWKTSLLETDCEDPN